MIFQANPQGPGKYASSMHRTMLQCENIKILHNKIARELYTTLNLGQLA